MSKVNGAVVKKLVEVMLTSEGDKLTDRIGYKTDGDAMRALAKTCEATPAETRDALEYIYRLQKQLGPGHLVLEGAKKKAAGAVSARDLLTGAASPGALGNMAAVTAATPEDPEAFSLPADAGNALLKKLDGAAISTGEESRFHNGAPSGFRELPRWALPALRAARQQHLATQLIGEYPPPKSDESTGEEITAASNALDAVMARPTTATRPLVDEIYRLQGAGARNLRAFVEERSGEIFIVERREPLEPTIASRIDSAANLAKLHTLVKQHVPDRAHDAAMEALSRKLPTDVFTLVEQAQLKRISILRSRYAFSDEADFVKIGGNVAGVYLLGKGAGLALSAMGVCGDEASDWIGAALELVAIGALTCVPTTRHPLVDFVSRFRASPGNTSGHVVLGDNVLEVAPDAAPRADETEGTLAHEMFHVLDFCMARHGCLSEEPEFKEIFEKTKAARERGDLIPDFPSEYAATDAKEFFAEAACSFFDVARPFGTRHANRAELKERNPEVYAYFVRLFGERLPKAIAENDVQPFSRAYFADVPIEQALAKPESERSGADWVQIAAMHLQRAEIHQDMDAVAQAQKALDAADKTLRYGWFTLSSARRSAASRSRAFAHSARQRLTSIKAEIEGSKKSPAQASAA